MSGVGLETTNCTAVCRSGLQWLLEDWGRTVLFENRSQALCFSHSRHICLNFDFSHRALVGF